MKNKSNKATPKVLKTSDKPKSKMKNSVKNSVTAKTTGNTEKSKSRTRGLIPFKPGESGNPKGRPKGKLNYDTRVDMAIQALAEIYVAQHNAKKENKGKEITLDDVDIEGEIFMQHLKKARSGDQKAIDSFLDRRHGKATARIELTGKNGNPIEIEERKKEAKQKARKMLGLWTK